MLLLPTQQTAAQVAALRKLLDSEGMTLSEPCDCGGQVRHNNGGNYHKLVSFSLDAGKCWRSETFTGDYGPPDDWKEIGFGETVDEIASLAAEGYRF